MKIRVLKNQSKMIGGGVGTICIKNCRQEVEGRCVLAIADGRGKDKRKSENERVEVKVKGGN